MDAASATSSASTAAKETTQSSAAAKEKEARPGATALSSDFETFLKMLTTQMQNQDPLNPIESSDFAVQLATFSGVEQQVRSNDLLESLLGQQSVSALSQVSNWVGMEARAPVAAGFDGSTPVTYYTDPPGGSDQATLTVKNDAGIVVSSSAIAVSAGPQTWSGTDQSGARLPAGSYTFSVEYRGGGEWIETKKAEVYAPVTEVRMTDGAPGVVFASGDELPAAEIRAVRAPGG